MSFETCYVLSLCKVDTVTKKFDQALKREIPPQPKTCCTFGKTTSLIYCKITDYSMLKGKVVIY
jgi:hypothetical protein